MALPLICLPYAAGSRFSYKSMLQQFPASIRPVPLDIPGRGSLFMTAPLKDIHLIVEGIYSHLAQQSFVHQAPYALYGHSMGAMLAYLLLHRMQQENVPMPIQVFLSGRGGACIPEKEQAVHQLPRQELIVKFRGMGGDIHKIVEDEYAWERYEPIIRADLAALDGFDYAAETRARLSVPACIFIGTHDLYTLAEARQWQKEFSQPISLHAFTGGHFFIFEHAQSIGQIIDRELIKTQSNRIINHSIRNNL